MNIDRFKEVKESSVKAVKHLKVEVDSVRYAQEIRKQKRL
jgi:hypothetical protein